MLTRRIAIPVGEILLVPWGRRSVTAVVLVGAGAILAGLALLLGPSEFRAVAGPGMDPTAPAGRSVYARKVDPSEIGRGNVVVFKTDAWTALPDSREPALVRRVVGVGGDTVSCCDASGRLVVNGKPVNEDYLPLADRNPAKARMPFDVKVPAGHFFVAGDHRGESVDSRDGLGPSGEGAIPQSDVLGVVVDTAGSVPVSSSAFAAAGLPGDLFDDSAERAGFEAMLIAGIFVAVIGLFWFIHERRGSLREA